MGRGELLLLALLMLAGCTTALKQPKNVLIMSSGLRLQPVTFSDLPDWGTGGQSEALTAFRLSCGKIVQMPASAPVGPDGFAGRAGDWYAPCRAADAIGNDDDGARLFFEQHFR